MIMRLVLLLAFLGYVLSHDHFLPLPRIHKFLKERSAVVRQMRHFEVVGITSHLPLTTHSTTRDEFSLPTLDTHPYSSTVKFSAFGHNFVLELSKSDIFAPTYHERRQTYRNGTLVHETATVLPPSRDCHYSTIGDSVSAALSTCQGAFQGLIIGHEMDTLFGIEPAGFHLTREDMEKAQKLNGLSTISNLHLIYKFSDYQVNGSCPLDEETHQHRHHHHETGLPNSQANEGLASIFNFVPPTSLKRKQQLQSGTMQYNELLITNDHLRKTQTMGYTEDNAVLIVNGANTLYQSVTFSPPVTLVLVAQVTFEDQDPWTMTLGDCSCGSGEVSVDTLLGNFLSWQSGPNAPDHDNAHLLSGYDFQNTVIGYADVDAMCIVSSSGGIEQTLNFPAAQNSATLAHEMGHNFGMQHDGVTGPVGNSCPASGFVMNSVIVTIPSQFSTCSVSYYEQFVSDFTCLSNVPTKKWGDPVCGNYFVETGEQCDCGPPPCLQDPCCDGSTCLLMPGAVCTAGQGCCDANCHPINDTSVVCRPAASSCDIPEYCDGIDAECPSDWYLGAGTSCQTNYNDSGGCYLGTCLSYASQCKTDTQSFGAWNPCTDSDQSKYNGDNFCGNLFCWNPAENICVFIQNADGSSDNVKDGVPCADGYQCSGGACVASDKLQTQFYWQPNAWQNCESCDEKQTRNLSCYFQDTTLASPPPPVQIPSSYCAPFSYPSLTQTCDNVTLGCIGSDLFAGSTIDFFGLFEVQKLALVLIVFGIVAGTIIVIAACYKAVTYEAGPPPNPRVRQIGKGQPIKRGAGGAKVRPQSRQGQRAASRAEGA